MKLSAAVTKVTNLAEAIRTYWERELPKRHPNYPIVEPGEDSGPPPPEAKKLRQLLTSLPDEDLYKLALVTYLGRGDFDTSDLAGAYHGLRDNFGDPADIVAQIMETAPLADYLTEGMAILKARNMDLDKIDLASAKAGK